MTPSPFTPAGLAISKIVAGIQPPVFTEPGKNPPPTDDEPRVPGTPREEEEFA